MHSLAGDSSSAAGEERGKRGGPWPGQPSLVRLHPWRVPSRDQSPHTDLPGRGGGGPRGSPLSDGGHGKSALCSEGETALSHSDSAAGWLVPG